MTSHSPRPLDSFLKRLPEGTQIFWIDELERRVTALPQRLHVEGYQPRAQLDGQTVEWLGRQGFRLDPWQKQVLSTHPAFRNLRRDHPSFLRLTHQSQIWSRSLWSRLLRRLRIR